MPKSKSPAARKQTTVAAFHRQYLSRPEAAAYLGFNRKTLIKFVKAGLIVEYEFGPSLRRYRREDLDTFAETRRTKARKEAA